MKTADEIIEEAIGRLYQGFYKLREANKHQEEYDSMGVLLNMLSKDRQHMREKYKVKS